MDIRRFRGERLRELRAAAKYSQSVLAGKIGAHVTSISDWERGDNAPSGRHVASLASVFDVTAESFYGDDEEEAAPVLPAAEEMVFALMPRSRAEDLGVAMQLAMVTRR